MFYKYIEFAFVLFSLAFITGNSNDIVSVTTNNGVVNGRTEVYLQKRVNVFLGIPYAEPPVNHRRFKKPIPVNNWTQPFNATQQPNPCYQRSNYPTFLNRNFSEDCLYLNIWQPINNTSTNNNNKLKAVMFFIYGGGLVSGSANEYAYQGQYLSTIGDVVVVVINYRLGVFGFFYTGTDDAPGNVAFWDQTLALEWVKDNIGYFGGDPNRVTIFGESAGSISESFLILSRYTRDLYKQAILMSGAIHNTWVYNKTQSKQNWLNGAKTIGCALESDTAFNSQIINCLININASVLEDITAAYITIDGTFLEKSPVELLESGNYKKNLNLMIGTVEDEGSVFFYNTPINLTFSESFQFLSEFASTLPVYATINGTEVAQLYYALISPNTTDYDLLGRISAIAVGDGALGCETQYFAQAILKNDRINSNVYQYYYTGKPKMPDDYYYEWLGCTDWMGTCHGTDLYPVFGMPFMFDNISSYNDIYDSRQAIGFFSHFAKFGYPSPQHGIDWPKYYMLNSHIVTPYFQMNNSHQSLSSFFGYGLKTTECEYLWRKSLYVKVPN